MSQNENDKPKTEARDDLDRRLSRDDLDEAAGAALGLNARALKTVWDSLVATPRVVEAALRGDRALYVSPIPLFLVLFSLQFALTAFFGINTMSGEDELAAMGMPEEAIDAWLEASGKMRAEVSAAIGNSYGYAIWPVTIISSLPYLLALKLFKPGRSWFSHLLTYLITVNASMIVVFLFLPFGILNPLASALIGSGISMVVFYIVTARVLAAFYADTVWGVCWRVLVLILLLPIGMILIQLGLLAAFEISLQFIDMSLLDLVLIAAQSESSP